MARYLQQSCAAFDYARQIMSFRDAGFTCSRMERFLNIMFSVFLTFSAPSLAWAASSAPGPEVTWQDRSYDVFVPIAKYLGQGNADKLSAWFADNLEISVISTSNDSSRSQARQILKAFFDSYTPRSFEITHTAGRSHMKYALGTLNAGGERFIVTIFVSYCSDEYRIQQLKIERMK